MEQRIESGGRLVEGNPYQDTEFFQYHPLLGHHGVPSHHATRGGKSVTTNARGFRGPLVPYEKAAGEKRIVLLGDSGVWGAEVGDSETLDAHLRGALAGDPTSHSVVNLGISGYGLDQSYLLFLLEGLRYDPDYVILVLFGENDLDEAARAGAWGVAKPTLSTRDGTLCVGNVPVPRAKGWINNRVLPGEGADASMSNWPESQIVRFLRSRELDPRLLRALTRARIALGVDSEYDRLQRFHSCIEEQPRPTAPRNRIALAAALVRALAARVDEAGAELLLLWKPLRDSYDGGEQDADLLALNEALEPDGLAVIDLGLEGRRAGLGSAELFAPMRHFTSRGHELTARTVTGWMRDSSRDSGL